MATFFDQWFFSSIISKYDLEFYPLTGGEISVKFPASMKIGRTKFMLHPQSTPFGTPWNLGISVVFLVLSPYATLLGQARPAIKLLEPSRSVAVDGGFQAEHITPGKWERGYLLSFDIDRSIVMAVDKSGKLVLRTQIAPPEASHVFLRDLSASPGGKFAVAFSAAASNGGPASFIAWLDRTGRTARLVRISSGVPYLLCFADDGSLWSAVQTRAGNGDQEAAQYDMLRHYDADGKLIGSALRREIFPAAPSATRSFPGEGGSLTASHDRVGFFAPASRIWAEISLAGADLGHWVLQGPKAEFSRAFLSQSGEVYVHQQERIDSSSEIVRSYLLDKASSTLREIDTSAIHFGQPAKLTGIDGDELVYQASYGPWLLKWASYERSEGSLAK